MLIVLLVISGTVLSFYFVPGKDSSYQSLVAISGDGIPFGSFWRKIHRFSAEALIIITILHLFRVFFSASYIKARKGLWVVGYLTFCFILISAFTGYVMRGTREGYWQAKVGSELLSKIPLIGIWLKKVFLSGDEITDLSYNRFFVLHILSGVIVVILSAWHLLILRAKGGLLKPKELSKELKEEVPFYPTAFNHYLTVALSVILILLILTVVIDLPLGEKAFPVQHLDPTKAPWFFLWIQELLRLGVVIGGLTVSLILILLAIIPYIDRWSSLKPTPFYKGRLYIILLFILLWLIIGFFTIRGIFRGSEL